MQRLSRHPRLSQASGVWALRAHTLYRSLVSSLGPTAADRGQHGADAERNVVDPLLKQGLHVAIRLVWEDEIEISDPSSHGAVNVVKVHC